MGEPAAEVEKLRNQLERAMKGFTMTKQQLTNKASELEESRKEVAMLRQERDSGNRLPHRLCMMTALLWNNVGHSSPKSRTCPHDCDQELGHQQGFSHKLSPGISID